MPDNARHEMWQSQGLISQEFWRDDLSQRALTAGQSAEEDTEEGIPGPTQMWGSSLAASEVDQCDEISQTAPWDPVQQDEAINAGDTSIAECEDVALEVSESSSGDDESDEDSLVSSRSSEASGKCRAVVGAFERKGAHNCNEQEFMHAVRMTIHRGNSTSEKVTGCGRFLGTTYVPAFPEDCHDVPFLCKTCFGLL